MWVTANFKETQLTLMRVGQPVSIKIDAFPDVAFEGHVDSVQRGAGQAFAILPSQNATGNFVKVVQRVPVRIVFDTKNAPDPRSEEHTSELQSLMRISYAVFCFKKKKEFTTNQTGHISTTLMTYDIALRSNELTSRTQSTKPKC